MNKVWMVLQTQRDCCYDDTAIYTFSDEELANKCAQQLNKMYGRGCIFDEEGNFVSEIADYESTHFYRVSFCQADTYDFNDEQAQKWVIDIYKDDWHCGWLTEDNETVQNMQEARTFTNYAEAIKLAEKLTDAGDLVYCVSNAE